MAVVCSDGPDAACSQLSRDSDSESRKRVSFHVLGGRENSVIDLLAAFFFVPFFVMSTNTDIFSDIRIEKPFDRYLLANPLLMESTGAKVIKLPKGKSLVVSVASTVLKDQSAAERLRAEKVCKVKAFAALVQEQKGVRVFHTEESTEKTIIVNLDGKETGKNVSELLEITKIKVQGVAKDMPVVGRWKSKEGDVFYLAIGGIVNNKGDLVQSDDQE